MFSGSKTFVSGSIAGFLNRRDVRLLSLMVFALIFNREGDRLPTGNEWIYLLYVVKAWHPAFLAGDWTFQETTAGHAIFNDVAGWPTLFLPLSVVAWVGRVLCWFFCFTAILRLSRRFPIPPWAGWAGIILWLAERQSLVTTEWVIGTFEAKAIAYACLLFAIDFAIDQRLLRAGILTGLAFSFHTAVGMWGGAALGVAVVLNSPLRKTVQFAGLTILFALPGLITSASLVFGRDAIHPDEARFLVTTELPNALDPHAYPAIWPVVMIGLLGVAAAHAVWRWDRRGVRMLFQFETATGLFFLFGLFARAVGRFDWVELYPLRVFSVLVMLLFFWQLADILWTAYSQPAGRPRIAVIAAGVIAFLCLPAPGVVLWETVRSHLIRAREVAGGPLRPVAVQDADFRAVADWIADEKNTPPSAVIICPPWRNDAFYLMHRPMIADWHAPRYDRMTEWRQRIESMVGPLSPGTSVDTDDDLDAEPRAFFANLSPAAIDDIRRRYADERSTFLISPSQYAFPQVFQAGGLTVYRVSP